jgi:hypothetical protein
VLGLRLGLGLAFLTCDSDDLVGYVVGHVVPVAENMIQRVPSCHVRPA